MSKIVWVSLDPNTNKVIYYPKTIATIIENSYNESKLDRNISSSCFLGSDFFNATVHFNSAGIYYQTTPGISLGRSSYKVPGFRSVKRCIVTDETITIHTKQTNREWRITNSEVNSERSYIEIPSPNHIIITDNLEKNINIDPWKIDDLNSESLYTLVVVWQWCKQTYGDISKYSDSNWCPYSNDINLQIEEAFKKNLNSTRINLSVIGERNIEFRSGECYANQVSLDNRKKRCIRRVVKTIQEVKEMFANIAKIPENYSDIVNNLSNEEVPHHYCCPILQEIMSNPVKTVDGFTYERSAIERWFCNRLTSPLTGLPLKSNKLVTNKELANEIAEYIKKVQNTSLADYASN